MICNLERREYRGEAALLKQEFPPRGTVRVQVRRRGRRSNREKESEGIRGFPGQNVCSVLCCPPFPTQRVFNYSAPRPAGRPKSNHLVFGLYTQMVYGPVAFCVTIACLATRSPDTRGLLKTDGRGSRPKQIRPLKLTKNLRCEPPDPLKDSYNECTF